MQLFLSNIISFEKLQQYENTNSELIYLLKDDYIFFYEKIYKKIYFCKKDIFEKMKILNEITIDFFIYSEVFNLFSFSIHQKRFSWINSINSIEARISKGKKCFIDTTADKVKKIYINRKKIFIEINYKELTYPKIMNARTISKLLKKTSAIEYDVSIKFLQATSRHIGLFEELRKEETLMKFNLTYPINYLFKFENKKDFLENILGEAYPYNLDLLKFDTAYELIQCSKTFLNKKDWGDFYYFAKNNLEKLQVNSPIKFRFMGMYLLYEYLIETTNIKDEKLLEDYITYLYRKKEKINLPLEKIKNF